MLARNLLALFSVAAVAIGFGGTFANWWLSLIVGGCAGGFAVWVAYRHDVIEEVVEEVVELEPVDQLEQQRQRRGDVG